MIIFITAKSNHPTKKQIVSTFMNAGVRYEIIHPSTPWFKMRKKFQNNVKLCILAPDHDNSFKICSYLRSSPIPIINPPRTTLLCRTRSRIAKELSKIITKFNATRSMESIHMPKSTYFKNKTQVTNQKEELEFPMVIKYPLNHSGIHYVELVKSQDELKESLPKWVNSVGIYTEQFIDAKEILIKSYGLGDRIITQKDTHHLALDQKQSLKTTIFESKNQRETIENPPIVEDFMKMVSKELNIIFFGADFLHTSENEYWLIDFNDFPGARGIFDAGEILANYAIANQK